MNLKVTRDDGRQVELETPGDDPVIAARGLIGALTSLDGAATVVTVIAGDDDGGPFVKTMLTFTEPVSQRMVDAVREGAREMWTDAFGGDGPPQLVVLIEAPEDAV